MKWRALAVLYAAEFLAMAAWFSASAVAPALGEEWGLGPAGRAWLTMSVQAGFVAGTLLSALLNLPDRLPAHRLFAACAAGAAAATALIPAAARGASAGIPLRFATGFFLAGVYPVGVKIAATWSARNRGLAIGLLVGALTLGTAAPHLLRVFSPADDWRTVLYGAALLATAGAAAAATFVREGPHRSPAPPFRWRYAVELAGRREVLLANCGYLGHMWELYAMWAWAPVFLSESFCAAGAPASHAALAAAVAIGAGAVGCLIAGALADRIGRTAVTMASLALSGACALIAGGLSGASPVFVTAVCTIWGFAVIADSGQFSACVTELSPREYAGTAVTLQTCLGFLLTLVTLRMVPAVRAASGWAGAFALLAAGPAFGILSMWLLRRHPAAKKMAGGMR